MSKINTKKLLAAPKLELRKVPDGNATVYGNMFRFIGSSVRQNAKLNFNDYLNFIPSKKLLDSFKKIKIN